MDVATCNLDPNTEPQVPKQTIPFWAKLVFTAFMTVLVPFYLNEYGPTNFLYFCDVALFVTLAAMWLESPLLASMAAVGIILPQIAWVVDFIGYAVDRPIFYMAGYMYDPKYTLMARGLSLFHGWLPFLLLWLVVRLRYDSRGLVAWTVLAWVLMVVAYFWMPRPPAPKENPNLPVNINYVYGLDDKAPQTWMPGWLWFTMMIIGLPVLIFLPTHLLLRKLFGPVRACAAYNEQKV